MKLFKYIAISAFVLLAASCDDFLDKNPNERVDSTNMTEEQIVALLRGSYPTANYGWIAELSSDNYIDNNAPHLPAKESDKQKPIHFNLQPSDRMDNEIFAFEPVKSSTSSDSPTTIWSGYYASIAQINQLLVSLSQREGFDCNVRTSDVSGTEATNLETKIDGLSRKMKAARAEAFLIRAYDHFVLVNLFSPAYRDMEASKNDVGVPYVKIPEDKVLVHYDRGNVADTYKEILADLEEGIKYMDDINCTKPAWRFNTRAAHALAARIYLTTRNYEKVIEHANAVLGENITNITDKLADFAVFDGCTMSDDYIKRWQSPEDRNNLMLLGTYSASFRRLAGQRYGLNSIPLREIYYRTGVNWRWTAHPHAITTGALYYRGKTDYGFFTMKCGEEFEYSDKIAGIGYAHVIRREFTANMLLLERAEAHLMLGHNAEALQDLIAWDNSRQTMSDENAKIYKANGGMEPLTVAMINRWFNVPTNPNCKTLDTWNNGFHTMSSSYPTLTAEQLPIMNCLNEFRRYETVQDGYRFWDLKRWGVEYSHDISDGEGGMTTITLTALDKRRAIEVPQECLAAGLGSSLAEKPTTSTGAQTGSYESASNEQTKVED